MSLTQQITFLAEPAWSAAIDAHQRRLGPFVGQHLRRRQRGELHPVHDFLFEYYFFRPSQLMRWSPGLGVVLMGESAEGFLAHPEYGRHDRGVMLDAARIPADRLDSARRIRDLLRATLDRAPSFACSGLHEWAMVYQTADRRHEVAPLRLSREEINDVVDSQSLNCTHYDAYRFFTEPARPLNAMALTRATQLSTEQPGCVHANMDLYKWATKFYPWIGSDLIADAFLLAVELRQLDMQASPYDLRAFGLEPVRIETAAGRGEYRHRQQELATRGQAIRERLWRRYQLLIGDVFPR
jgi:hypothetical protein